MPESNEPKMFPLQRSRTAPAGPREIPWIVAEKAYAEYSKRYGMGQSLERLAERGGFGWCEMDTLYPAWRTETDKVLLLESALARVTAERDEAVGLIRKAGESIDPYYPRHQGIGGEIRAFLSRLTADTAKEPNNVA